MTSGHSQSRSLNPTTFYTSYTLYTFDILVYFVYFDTLYQLAIISFGHDQFAEILIKHHPHLDNSASLSEHSEPHTTHQREVCLPSASLFSGFPLLHRISDLSA